MYWLPLRRNKVYIYSHNLLYIYDNADLHRLVGFRTVNLQIVRPYSNIEHRIISAWGALNLQDQKITDLGANYKKNLKIILRCDNNLR